MRTRFLVTALLALFSWALITPVASATGSRGDAPPGAVLLSDAMTVPISTAVATEDPSVPVGCRIDIDQNWYRNYVQSYYGGGACSRCFAFGNEGIYQGLWDDFKCWMTSGGSYLIAELWVHMPGNPTPYMVEGELGEATQGTRVPAMK